MSRIPQKENEKAIYVLPSCLPSCLPAFLPACPPACAVTHLRSPQLRSCFARAAATNPRKAGAGRELAQNSSAQKRADSLSLSLSLSLGLSTSVMRGQVLFIVGAKGPIFSGPIEIGRISPTTSN